MEELETLDVNDCPECPGPPPEFRLPPPPRPPFLTEGTFCSEAPLAELEDCVAIPMIDASYHTNPSLQSTALIITSAVILLLMAAIISVVFWKHKRKVQNLLPCKSAAGAAAAAASSRNRGGVGGGGGVLSEGQPHGGVIGGSILYEDLPDTLSNSRRGQYSSGHLQIGGSHQIHHQQQQQLHNHQQQQQQQQQQQHHHQQQQQQLPGIPGGLHHRPGVQPTIEMLDVSDGSRGVFVCSSPGGDPYKTSQDSYNPVYEELGNGDLHGELLTDEENEPSARSRLTNHRRVHASSKTASDDEFAEDELSLGEPSEARILTSGGTPAWGTCPAAPRPPRGRRGRSPRSLDRRRKDKTQDVGEFHEGMLLDALLQLYPSVAGVGGSRQSSNVQRQQSVPSVAHRLPYFVPQLPATPAMKVEENPYETVPVLGPLHRYTTLGNSHRGSGTKERSKCGSRYNGDYYGLQNQDLHSSGGPVYTQVGGDYSDAYSQPTDRLYHEEKYAQPVYYTPREPEHVSAGRLYQGQPDSSFGSDSGYSHHTSGTTGTRGSSSRANHRKDKHRNSHHSMDYVLS